MLKPSSIAAVRALRKLGLEVVMLTGDNRQTAEAIATEVGIRRVLQKLTRSEAATVQALRERKS